MQKLLGSFISLVSPFDWQPIFIFILYKLFYLLYLGGNLENQKNTIYYWDM